MKRLRNLQTILSIVFMALTAILVLLLVFVVSKQFSRGLQKEIGQSLAQVADHLQSELDARIFERKRDIEIGASLDAFRKASSSQDERRALLDTLQRTYPAYAWIGFAAMDGKVQASSGSLLEGRNVGERPWFRQAAASSSGAVTLDVHQAKLLASKLPNTTGEPLRFFDVATLVKNTEGVPIGVLGAHLSWSWAGEIEKALLASLRQHKHLETFILDRDGEVLLGPKGYLGATLEVPSVKASSTRKVGYLIETWDDGKRYLTGYAKSRGHATYAGMGWTVLVRQSLDEAYVPVSRIKKEVAGYGFLFCFFFAMAGLLIARRIARPLLAISEAADQLRAGKVHANIPISAEYKEVHRLAYSIRSLLESRLQAEQELRLLNQSLEQRVAERTKELSASEARTSAIVKGLSDGIVILDLQGRIRSANPAFCRIFGYAAGELEGERLSRMIPDLQINSQHELVCRPGQTGVQRPDKQNIELEGICRDRSLVHIDIGLTTMGPEEEASRFICVVRDITQRKLDEAHQAAHDILTGLFNRREFERRLGKALEHHSNHGLGHALLYLDIDQFKIVNDLCGRVAGDELLKSVAGILKSQLREADALARLGGDEFAVLVQNCNAESALGIADAILHSVSGFTFAWREKSFGIAVSIGLLCFDKDTFRHSDMLSAAEAACYMAKEKGRNRIQVFLQDEEEFAQRLAEMDWVSRIHKALQKDRFCLHAQKILPIGSSGHANGHYELLVRMVDEHGRLVPPAAFIPAAERYDLMPAIDRWIIAKAFSFLANAHACGHVGLCFAINLSGASLNDGRALSFIREQFAVHGIPNQAICFEITETAAIANLAKANAFIQALRTDGCKFSLDDFGSGMSSFAYLKSLPVDYLKIDGSFVKDIVDNPIDHAMVEAIHHIGRVMNIRTIAEYVENDAILKKLASIGIDYAQGYGVAKPCPLESIADLDAVSPGGAARALSA